MDITTWVRPIIELGFPVVVAVYLLLVQSKQLEKFANRLSDLKVGLYLILSKLNAIEEYERTLKDRSVGGYDSYKRKEEKEDG